MKNLLSLPFPFNDAEGLTVVTAQMLEKMAGPLSGQPWALAGKVTPFSVAVAGENLLSSLPLTDGEAALIEAITRALDGCRNPHGFMGLFSRCDTWETTRAVANATYVSAPVYVPAEQVRKAIEETYLLNDLFRRELLNNLATAVRYAGTDEDWALEITARQTAAVLLNKHVPFMTITYI